MKLYFPGELLTWWGDMVPQTPHRLIWAMLVHMSHSHSLDTTLEKKRYAYAVPLSLGEWGHFDWQHKGGEEKTYSNGLGTSIAHITLWGGLENHISLSGK